MSDTIQGSIGPHDPYVFTGHPSAATVFGQRSAQSDFPFLLPYLTANKRVVDCGCGSGTIAIDMARLVAPGTVVGFDVSEEQIAVARAGTVQGHVANADFLVGDIAHSGLDKLLFDVATICNVLAHLRNPEDALSHVYDLLSPGGIVAIVEMQKQGDWYGGPFHDAAQKVNDLFISDLASRGRDPRMGARLGKLLTNAGFRIELVRPRFSPVLSNVGNAAKLLLGVLKQTDFVDRAIGRGELSQCEVPALQTAVTEWSESPLSVAALSECTALASKPESG